MEKFWYTRELDTSFLEAVDDVIFALKEQWFWILNTIDLQAKIKEKLWKDIEEYLILWACNPTLASEALEIEYEIWLFLPCNVIVYKKNDKIFVSAIVSSLLMSIINNDTIMELAKSLDDKLKKAIDRI